MTEGTFTMNMTRRRFLAATGAGTAALSIPRAVSATTDVPGLRVGICDWTLGAKGEKAFAMAKEIGLDGLQVSPKGPAEVLSYATKEEQDMYARVMKETGLQVASAGLNVTNRCPLVSDPRGPAWLTQTIDAAVALGAKATLIAFFGKGNLRKGNDLKKDDVDKLVAILKEAAPYAREKGVALGLENTLSGRDNMTIIERVGSPAVQVYYDIANSTSNGYDVPAEIRMLKGRICEFHFKNTEGVFGESGVQCEPIAEAINEIGYAGWLVMERSFGKDKTAYFKQNAAYIRKLFGLPRPA